MHDSADHNLVRDQGEGGNPSSPSERFAFRNSDSTPEIYHSEEGDLDYSGQNSSRNAHAHYANIIRPLLPPEAFRRRPQKLWFAAANLGLVLLACVVLRTTNRWFAYPLASIIVGHSIICMGFFAHDLSHGSVLKRGILRRFVEEIVWGFNLISPTLWKVVHNQSHHVETNTLLDPDRRFLERERTLSRTAYMLMLYPSGRTLRWNPLVFVQFLGYIFRQLFGALGGSSVAMVPSLPKYSKQVRVAIAVEFLIVVLLQLCLFFLVGCSWLKYLFVGPLALAVTSMIAMTYIFTNHFLNPIHAENDPLTASTSVIVPRWVDYLHSHFSYHTEHHVFPAIDSRFYPSVSELLAKHFPEKYNRIPLSTAWVRLWKTDLFSRPPKTLAERGHGR